VRSDSRYNLVVSQDVHEVRPFGPGGASQVAGLKRIRGSFIELDEGSHLRKLFGSDGPLTLHLEDGRRWDCLLKDTAGAAFSAGQGLYTPTT